MTLGVAELPLRAREVNAALRSPSSVLRLVAASALALVVSACGGEEAGDRATGGCTWTIGTMGALSGDDASFGIPIFQGVEHAVNKANEAGELPCRLQLQREDSQGKPDQAPQLAQNLVENENLVAVAGPYFSGETLASGDIFSQAGVAFVALGTNETIDERGFETWFRAVAPDDIQAEVAADYIVQGLGASRVAVIHDNQDYSKGLAEGVLENLSLVATKGPLVISPEESDYSAVVSQVREFDPDLVYYGGYSAQAGPLAKQLEESGVDAQFLSDDATKDPSFGELAGESAEGVQVTCPCSDPMSQERARDFVEGMRAEYGEQAPGTFAADMYDVTNVILDSLKGLDGDEPIGDVRAHVVEHFDEVRGIEGVTKTYTWNESGEFQGGREDIWIYEWSRESGNFVSIGPAEELL